MIFCYNNKKIINGQGYFKNDHKNQSGTENYVKFFGVFVFIWRIVWFNKIFISLKIN